MRACRRPACGRSGERCAISSTRPPRPASCARAGAIPLRARRPLALVMQAPTGVRLHHRRPKRRETMSPGTPLRPSTLLAVTLAVASGAFVLSDVSVAGSPPAPNTEESRIQRGYQIAPVTLHTKRLDKALVGLGSYIVNAQGGC